MSFLSGLESHIIKDYYRDYSDYLQDYDIIQKLGEGSFGQVVLVNYERVNCALKVMEKIKIEKRRQRKYVVQEIRILSLLSHQFINKMISFGENESKVIICLEFVDGGDLFGLMTCKGSFNEDEARLLISQIIIAVQHIHDNRIVYRDLKPENILIDTRNRIKLSDFGLSKELVSGRCYTFCGSPEYMAPEVVLNQGYHYPVDWWAIGILLYELIYQVTPYCAETISDVCSRISEGKLNFPSKPKVSNECQRIIGKLLDKNSVYRLGSSKTMSKEVENHKWFSSFNWYNVKNGYFDTLFRVEAIKIKKNL